MKTHLKNLIQDFGINQNQLAAFFSVHRSYINHILNGNRELPAGQATLIAGLRQQEKNSRSKRHVNPGELALSTAVQQEGIALLNETRLQLARLKRKLLELEQQWEKTEKNRHFSELLRMGEAPLTLRQQRWIEELEYHNNMLRPKCEPGMQWLIRCRIAGLTTQLEALQKNLKENKVERL